MFPTPSARRSRRAGLRPAPQFARRHHPDFDRMATQGWKALEAEGKLPATAWRKERQWALDMGLPGAESITDRDIPTFARGELPHFAGINTFMKAPYIENVRDVGRYDAAVIGIPFDSGTTYRPGTRFGPQGIRRISALYTPYNYELGVDLREQMTLCDVGDVFTIPANLEKSFDQITRGVAHVFSSGALPIMLGGDHSIGFPCVRGIAQCTDKKIGIGVVNHCNTVVEPAEHVAALIRKALEYIPKDQLVISTDCGFGREGLSRRIAFYKCVALVEGTNIVRRELGLPEARVRAADPKLWFAGREPIR